MRVEPRSPGHRPLSDLIGELTTASREFEKRWAAHDVRDHRRGTKVMHHPQVGELHLQYEALEVADRPGMKLFGYTPDPEHPASRERLGRLDEFVADRA